MPGRAFFAWVFFVCEKESVSAMPIEARRLSRRRFLLGSSGGVLAIAAVSSLSSASKAEEIRIVAGRGTARLRGADQPETEVWSYDGTIPGRILRLRQGQPVRILVENGLDEDTTVHWHGIRLPNNMDGVPGLTQEPIRPGEVFIYEFTPPDAGTFWYHPHADSLQQLGRGLAGVLIVEEAEPPDFDRDIVWMLSDWRLTIQGQIAPGFGNSMEAAMSGRVGNTVTLNGSPSSEQRVKPGERLRLRLINGSLARIMALRIEGHRPLIVAIDGQPCEPHEPDGERLLLAPAMRVDVMLDMQGKSGARYTVTDDYYEGLAYRLTSFVYDQEPPLRERFGPPPALPRNPLFEPEIARAHHHTLTLQGGMMGGGAMSGVGGMNMKDMDHGTAWAINGMSMTGDGHAGMAPLFALQRGQSCVLTLQNETAWWHPMHFHGHSLKLLSRNGKPVPYKQWIDTVLLAPKDVVDCAFVADNPGDWMLHCHVTDHQMAGLMTVLRIT
jgi:FtsP/CotA-like multicopper oxidase with cupredoxin domain